MSPSVTENCDIHCVTCRAGRTKIARNWKLWIEWMTCIFTWKKVGIHSKTRRLRNHCSCPGHQYSWIRDWPASWWIPGQNMTLLTHINFLLNWTTNSVIALRLVLERKYLMGSTINPGRLERDRRHSCCWDRVQESQWHWTENKTHIGGFRMATNRGIKCALWMKINQFWRYSLWCRKRGFFWTFEIWALTIIIYLGIRELEISIGGSKGALRASPLLSKFFHFYAVFDKYPNPEISSPVCEILDLPLVTLEDLTERTIDLFSETSNRSAETDRIRRFYFSLSVSRQIRKIKAQIHFVSVWYKYK